MTMNCDEWFEKLYAYLDKDKELGEKEIGEIELHMRGCRPCWDRAEFEKKLKERIRSSCCVQNCTEALKARIKIILDKF